MILGCVVVLPACSNIYKDFPEKSSDTYRIDAARNALDSNNYSNAISEISPVLATQPQNAEVAYLASAAYAGRAGLRILDLFEQIANSAASKGLLYIFAQHFSGADADDIADFEQAVQIFQNYSDFAVDRSTDLNFYGIFLYYARIGILLNYYALDPTAGTVLSNFDACHRVVDAAPGAVITGLPNAAVDKIFVTLPRIIEIVNAITLGSSFANLTDISSLPALPRAAIPCTSSSNNVQCLGVRTLVNVGPSGNGIGLGSGSGICLVTTP